MSKLQGFKRLIIEDFDQKDRNLVGKLAYAINTFADDIIQAIGGNLTITDNLAAKQKVINITVDSSGKPINSTSVQTGLSTKCSGIQVINALNNTNSSHKPTSCPFINFNNNGNSIIINNVTGLQASEQYQLTIILWPSS